MTTQKPWIENHALAIAQFEIGWAWQRFVGSFFAAHGLTVRLPKLEIRESIEQVPEFSDQWDLDVAGHRIEVKSRNVRFTSDPGSFRWDRPFVDTVRGYDGYNVKPIAYVFVSQITGALLSTPANEKERGNHWQVASRRDSVRQINEDFYTTSRHRVSSIDLLVNRLRSAAG